ncbi:hypothetical protein BDW22DRAFT_1358325 [Trametopsis cervina]|nr:hypothetical protein BDW22DRAFT_1358325 [Trametopsis cervina]
MWPQSQSRNRTSAYTNAAALESLPSDILLEIASYLSDGQRLQLALTCTEIYPKTIPSLYPNVSLTGPRQCQDTLSMLSHTPDLARHVRSLVLRPDPTTLIPSSSTPSEDGEDWCTSISYLIMNAAPFMDALHAFEWHSHSGTPVDDMWGVLRASCPNLTDVRVISSSSLAICPSLSSFSNLRMFALSVAPARTECLPRSGTVLGGSDRITSNAVGSIPPRLLDMLSRRCPDLRSLTLEIPVGGRPMGDQFWDATWPHLRTLTVSSSIQHHEEFLTFLGRHPSINRLCLSAASADLSLLSVDALPRLQHLTGTVNHLTALASRGEPVSQYPPFSLDNPQAQFPASSPLSKTLESLVLTEHIRLQMSTPFAIYHVLVGLTQLTRLKIIFDAQGELDPSGVLKTMVAARPGLVHLDLTMTSKAWLSMDTTATLLSRLTELRTLRLTIVQMPGDKTMISAAKRLATVCRRLTNLNVKFVPAQDPGRPGDSNPEVLYEAQFDIEHDFHDVPTTLFAVEHYHPSSGRSSTRTRHDLASHTVQTMFGVTTPVHHATAQNSQLYAYSACLLLMAAWTAAMGLIRRVGETTIGAHSALAHRNVFDEEEHIPTQGYLSA